MGNRKGIQMSIDAKEIIAAVSLMDAKDAAQWEDDGSPKFSILQTLTNQPALTAEDVAGAIGDFKRGQKLKDAKPAVKATASEGTGIAPAGPPVTPVDLSTLDPQSPEYATAMVNAARAEDALLKAEYDAVELERNALSDRLKDLTRKRDVVISAIETYAPKISHAAAVKAIQAQTQANLAGNKLKIAAVTSVLQGAGVQPAYPSKLDQVLATRKRGPEQTANYAKFVHQAAEGRSL